MTGPLGLYAKLWFLFDKFWKILHNGERSRADEEIADGCSGNAEAGSPGSGIAGARGASAEAARGGDTAAGARAARGGAEPGWWAAAPAGGKRLGPSHARDPAGSGSALRGGVK